MDGDHLQQSLSGGQPAAHHSLQQGFALFILILCVQLDVQLLNQFGGFLFLEVHDGIEHLENEDVRFDHLCIENICNSVFCLKSYAYLENGVQDELGEGAGQFLSIRAIGGLAEFTSGWVKIPKEQQTMSNKVHKMIW